MVSPAASAPPGLVVEYMLLPASSLAPCKCQGAELRSASLLVPRGSLGQILSLIKTTILESAGLVPALTSVPTSVLVPIVSATSLLVLKAQVTLPSSIPAQHVYWTSDESGCLHAPLGMVPLLPSDYLECSSHSSSSSASPSLSQVPFSKAFETYGGSASILGLAQLSE